MAYASRSGRARTSATRPMAHATCDRCGFRYNHVDLKWNFDWRGAALQNTRILVCDSCLDKPQEQLRAIVLPADPDPIVNARVEQFADDETDFLSISGGTKDPATGIFIPNVTQISTEDKQSLTTQPVGPRPNADIRSNHGLEPLAQMALVAARTWGKLNVLSMISSGEATIFVTTTSPHGLNDNGQIAVQGVTQQASGIFSVVVKSATSFYYWTNTFIQKGSLLGPKTVISASNVGIPYNYSQVPLTGLFDMAFPQTSNFISEQLIVTGTNTLSALSHPPNGEIFYLVVNGSAYFPATGDCSYVGTTVTWSGGFSLTTSGFTVVAVYTY